MNQEEDITELAKALKRGSREAFEIVYTRHFEAVRSYCQKLLLEEESAADAAQDVFVKLLTHPEKLNIRGTIRGYLFVMARHLCVDHYRLADKTRKYYRDAIGDPTLLYYEVFNDRMDELWMQRMLKALDRLPSQQRTVLVKSYLERTPASDLANQLHITLEAIYVLKSRALSNLRRMMNDASITDKMLIIALGKLALEMM